MKITITRKENRNLLECTREDGSRVSAGLGPGLPHHDLAHYVIERKLQLAGGFFGKLAEGFTVAQLSDREVIRTLGREAMIAEVVTRALQSLYSGACRPEQFLDLVNAELSQWGIAALAIEPATIDAMLIEYRGLLVQFGALRNGQSLALDFLPTA
jgi:hypothetical protein